ncbi:hypothetical protein D915_000898 [Fasciola hepatica]|uniref:Uncharacterized protein n=1 Tax=Fasciola hepatica TaxID=6192 RepID=A0A4E0S307_FASHE|nr:hypothetical protein D915_000898 [Fasciola hepatica]
MRRGHRSVLRCSKVEFRVLSYTENPKGDRRSSAEEDEAPLYTTDLCGRTPEFAPENASVLVERGERFQPGTDSPAVPVQAASGHFVK